MWRVRYVRDILSPSQMLNFGLDLIQKEGKREGELRRMVVSGQHVRRGVAARIVEAAIVRAKSHDLPSIYLSTSILQEAAVSMYKKLGWVEEGRREFSAFGASAQAISMRLYLSGKPLGDDA